MIIMISRTQYHRIPLITYFIILLVHEINFEPYTTLLSSQSAKKQQKSCAIKMEESPFGPGSVKSILCNLGNYAYAIYAKIGTPGYGVWLEIDTGSADSWILTSKCKSSSCILRKRFDIEKSSRTIRKIDQNFNVTYGHGIRVKGHLISDRICLAKETCLYDRTFGSVTSISQNGMYSDGVLGLGLDRLSQFRLKGRTSQSFLSVISKLNPNMNSVFGLKLKRHTFDQEDAEYGGEITFGYVNRTGTQSGLLLPLLPQNIGYWMVQLESVEFEYKDPKTRISLSDIPTKAILDTGSTCILSSSLNLRSTLNRWLMRGVVGALGDHVITNCHNLSVLPNLHFSFGEGRRVQLTPEEYTIPFDPFDPCKRRICLQFIPQLQFTVLGSVFLSNFHTIFNYGNRRIELIKERSEGTVKHPVQHRFNFSTESKAIQEKAMVKLPFQEFVTCLVTVIVIVMLAPFR